MKIRLGLAALLLAITSAFAVASWSGPVSAEQPTPTLRSLEEDGVFINLKRPDKSSIDRAAVAATVQEARSQGYVMAVLFPIDPLPELRSFVLRVQQAGEYDAVIGFGLEGEIEAATGDRLSSEQLGSIRAVRAAEGTPEELAALFLTELTTEPEPEIPPIAWRLTRWVAYLVAALVLAGLAEQAFRHFSKRGFRDQPAV